jgi:hypothetical protein
MKRAIDIVVVEGALEVAAALKLLHALDVPIDDLFPIDKMGCTNFWRDAPKYNQAARQSLVFGLADLDQHPCPSGLIAGHLKHGKHPNFILRIPKRELESWLLADADAMAQYLKLSLDLFPRNPDAEPDPKQTLVNLARRSTRTELREDLVPASGSKGMVGRGYTSRVTEFIETHWRPMQAQQRSESLRRAIAALRQAVATS